MLRTLLTRFILAAGLIAWTASAAPTPNAPELPSPEERLNRLARLWGQVKYRHPSLAYKSIDWDAALMTALPRVEAAKDRAAYAAAVQDMLETLNDPATRILRPDERQENTPADPSRTREPRRWEGKDVLVVNMGVMQPTAPLREELSRAKAVILDLRARGLDPRASESMRQALGEVLPLLLTQELQVPGPRAVYHSGYRPQTISSSGGFATSFLSSTGERISPQAPGKALPLLFLLDDQSSVDARVLTMKAQGLAQLVTEGRLDDGSSVQRTRVDLGAGLTAVVRLSELGVPLRADAVLPKRSRSGKDEALLKALELARKPVRGKAPKVREADLPPGRWQADLAYADMPYPDKPHRLLALFRMWNIIEFFYPYKHLMDQDWDKALSTFLPRFSKAKDAAEYALAVAEMSTWLKDGHTTLHGHPELEQRGIAGVLAPFETMELEGKAVVTRVWDEAAAPGLAPGQIIETYEGKPLAERMEALKPYVTASTPAHLRHRLLARALSGAEGSQATVGVRDAAGQRKQVRFTRSLQSLQKPPTGDAWRMLGNGVGYVDLTRLRPTDVATLFEKMKSTKALVFDMRGYPNGTAWVLAPYLNARKAPYGAIIERNIVSSEELGGRYKYFQPLPQADVTPYVGRTVMLIDERTISQAEYTGLFLEAANNTTFIGTPSAGADGDVTNMVLPGGIALLFSGDDVRHVDGRQLQRVGLKPQVFVRPSLASVQKGQDEVLERALKYLVSKGVGAKVTGGTPR
ncbi:peptidase S41 [Cystobacter fuscus]|uniref:S41 family peptidase n=1 Tax=Cystobacter fuscus TaxID=43 RepID=UPI002B2ADDDF|nr:peptidase S41 [Cystobacter fuscus]